MEQLLAIIFGAVISAFVGVLTVYFTGKMREQEWKRENIYKPLYNEVSSLAVTKWFGVPNVFSTKWSTINSYSRLLVDKELRDAFDEYESKIKEYNLINAKYNEVFERFLLSLGDAVKKALAQLLTEDKKSILLEKRNGTVSVEVKTWVSMFKEPLLSCKSGEELCQTLIEYSEARNWGHERYFKKWWYNNPKIFDDLVEECSNIRQSLEHEEIYKSLQEKRKQITSYATNLKRQLEKRINKLW